MTCEHLEECRAYQNKACCGKPEECPVYEFYSSPLAQRLKEIDEQGITLHPTWNGTLERRAEVRL